MRKECLPCPATSHNTKACWRGSKNSHPRSTSCKLSVLSLCDFICINPLAGWLYPSRGQFVRVQKFVVNTDAFWFATDCSWFAAFCVANQEPSIANQKASVFRTNVCIHTNCPRGGYSHPANSLMHMKSPRNNPESFHAPERGCLHSDPHQRTLTLWNATG
jgi:hypothetical protein